MSIAVLLVEDVQQLRGVVADLLATLGDFTVAAQISTEAEANLWLEENRGAWQLAVVDLILQQGTGMGVIARCRNRPAGSKVVVFSDYATPGIEAHCLRLGADAVFHKSEGLAALGAFCSALLPAAPTGPPTGPPR